MTDLITIHIDTHPSGRGFQITIAWNSHHLHYPRPILDVDDALSCAFRLKADVERKCGIRIPDTNIRISQESIERNAMLTENNRKAYAGIMTGKVKVTR